MIDQQASYVPSLAIVLAIIIQTVVMTVFLMLSTKKIEVQTIRLASEFNKLMHTIAKLEHTMHHQDKMLTDHEARLRASEYGSRRDITNTKERDA